VRTQQSYDALGGQSDLVEREGILIDRWRPPGRQKTIHFALRVNLVVTHESRIVVERIVRVPVFNLMTLYS